MAVDLHVLRRSAGVRANRQAARPLVLEPLDVDALGLDELRPRHLGVARLRLVAAADEQSRGHRTGSPHCCGLLMIFLTLSVMCPLWFSFCG